MYWLLSNKRDKINQDYLKGVLSLCILPQKSADMILGRSMIEWGFYQGILLKREKI